MFQHFKTIVAVILRFIYFPGCYHELWQNKFLQIIIFHNNFFSHVKNPACLTENQSMQLSSKHSLHTSSRWMLKACFRYFLSNFYFSPNDSPAKTMKNVFYFI